MLNERIGKASVGVLALDNHDRSTAPIKVKATAKDLSAVLLIMLCVQTFSQCVTRRLRPWLIVAVVVVVVAGFCSLYLAVVRIFALNVILPAMSSSVLTFP